MAKNEIRAEVIIDIDDLLGTNDWGESIASEVKGAILVELRKEVKKAILDNYKKEIYALASKAARAVFFEGDGVTIPPLVIKDGKIL